MTDQLDDWEGRLAAMVAGVRYRAPSARRARPVRESATAKAPIGAADADQEAFLAEPCPCDRCELRHQCATAKLACERFALFMRGQSPARWRTAPAAPTRERFEHLQAAF